MAWSVMLISFYCCYFYSYEYRFSLKPFFFLCTFDFQVYFDENRTIDINISKKDFFYKVFHEMISPESGMFMFNDSETLAWFASTVSL